MTTRSHRYWWRAFMWLTCTACAASTQSASDEVLPASAPIALDEVPTLKETDRASSQPVERPIDERAKSDYQSGVQLVSSDVTKAMEAFERALQREPRYCNARVNLAILKERQKRGVEAESDYKRAVELEPKCSAAWAGLARALLRQGRVADADAMLRKGLAANQNELLLRNVFAEVQLLNGKFIEAEQQALQILKVDERNTLAMLNLSRAYAAQRKPELARLAAENAQAVEPGNAEVLHQLGVLLLDKGERAKALALFRRAAFLRPDAAASQINLSQLLGEAGDFEGAFKAAETAVAFEPQSRRARLALANAHRGIQNYREAEQEYQKLLDGNANDRDALYNLAILYLDAELPGIELEARLDRAIIRFNDYLTRFKPGPDEAAQVNGYLLQARRQIDSEKKRKERDEKRKIKEAQKAASSLPSSQPTTSQPASRPASRPSK